jgi:hypothetical protein
MTKEIHYFLFSKEEVFSALVDYQYSLARPLPKGSTATLRMTERTDGIEATVQCRSEGNPDEETELTFSSMDLLAAIILYCSKGRIPMAARANKRLELLGDQLALLTTMNLEHPRPETHNNAIRYTDDAVESRRKAIR